MHALCEWALRLLLDAQIAERLPSQKDCYFTSKTDSVDAWHQPNQPAIGAILLGFHLVVGSLCSFGSMVSFKNLLPVGAMTVSSMTVSLTGLTVLTAAGCGVGWLAADGDLVCVG